MKIQWRVVLIGIIVLVFVAVVIIGLRKNNSGSPIETANLNLTPTPILAEVLPVATGNIDDIANSLLSDANKEAARIYQDQTDSSAVNYDNAAVSNFGQSYENNF